MFSFRQKIFLSYLLLFLIFLILLSPFSSVLVRRVVMQAMENRASELIAKIQNAPNNEALIRRIKEQKALIFFRVSVITNERKVLYDSHTKRLLGPRFSQEFIVDHPEVNDAFKSGWGFNEDYSDLLSQKFAYMARAFDFHGKTYVLRTAFPYRYVSELSNDFEFGFLLLATAVLLLFSVLTWFIINHLAKPIQEITNAVSSYRDSDTLPEIKLSSANPGDDISKLANTLNSLSANVQNQFNRLSQERTQKAALLESLVEGVIAIDENNTITYANSSASELLGINFSTGNAYEGPFRELILNAQHQQKPLTESMQLKKTNQTLYLEAVAAPIQAGTGAILVIQDQSSTHRMLEMRKDFIANASHELKTPITIIRGFAETLHDNPELPEQTTVDITGKIVRNCERMATLVKDLLALADIENLPESRLHEFDLTQLTERCCQQLRELYPDAKVTFNSTPEIYFTGDPVLIEMAINNLLTNAAKYSNPPADITVHLSDTAQNITLTVQDKGIGIPKSDLPRIFERFYRVNKAHSLKVGGSGLGLAIVETTIRKHFGEIKVDSEVGKGTTFIITLPKN